jgi:hypothetical protein
MYFKKICKNSYQCVGTFIVKLKKYINLELKLLKKTGMI